MKTRKRILGVRRHSMVRSPSKNLWFFSEDSFNSQSGRTENKSARNDRTSIMQEDFDRYSREECLQEKGKEECNFIVDWQMSDNI